MRRADAAEAEAAQQQMARETTELRGRLRSAEAEAAELKKSLAQTERRMGDAAAVAAATAAKQEARIKELTKEVRPGRDWRTL
eukprot:2087584-Pleurochrysis_carterae.AAC.1